MSVDFNYCYKHNSSRASYNDANSLCREESGTLVMPKTKQQLIYLTRTIYKLKPAVWIGLRDVGKNRTFFWDDNEILGSWSMWAKGRPKKKTSREYCVVMSMRSMRWVDVDCGGLRESICQVDKTLTRSECTVEEITNGTVSTNSSTIPLGTTITYACDDGLNGVSGSEVRTCLVNGNLSGTPLECAQICPPGWTASTELNYCFRYDQVEGYLHIRVEMAEEPEQKLLDDIDEVLS